MERKFLRMRWLRFYKKGHKQLFAQEFYLESPFSHPLPSFGCLALLEFASFMVLGHLRAWWLRPLNKLRSGYSSRASCVRKYVSTCLPGKCAGWEDTVLSRNIVGASWSLGETDITQRTREIKMKLVLGGVLWRRRIQNFQAHVTES